MRKVGLLLWLRIKAVNPFLLKLISNESHLGELGENYSAHGVAGEVRYEF